MSFVTNKMTKLIFLTDYISILFFYKWKNVFCHILEIMNFWKKVDEELSYLGKTRKELANAIGFDVTNISFGIKRNSVPAADTALKVARFLGVSIGYLLDMDEDLQHPAANSQLLEIYNKLRHFSPTDLNAILAIVSALNEKY
ncbi:helix-turn-helix domain-containing protein [Treponema zioleckii]|uniref:helix-turn-helix domain-containing protein n=1 Tax=Treponema zioleckii TaxID=331680 RepID=UPI00168BBCAF|nr:helix-turn-helix transcriptional regulator [Treponema zioleckii]